MIVLVDHNLRGYIVLLQGTLSSEGWFDLLPISFVMFEEVDLAVDASDRLIWRFAQENRMLLLTANRNAKGKDSLELTIREEGISTSLPVITIGSLDRLIELEYREQCSACLVDIILYIDNYLGVGRLFIP
ncbi:ACP S-malonyltransferase [Nostoc sp. MG11]|uniref:ACP S-malonyltransferase n=1 Tax=Nostoc sp. MG11 TaxID=2721166 RepID=UPI001868A232|nr:ACP S-malonyltransferase [Nostoc sp. MG11]